LKKENAMDEMKKISEQRLALLLDAMEQLHDMRIKMALFENQNYQKLKGRVAEHTRLTEVDEIGK
jgi:hypothetical protein